MSEYKYQMHIHTYPCSGCGRMSPAELCQALHDCGYQGGVLTNHFYHGNSGIDRSDKTSWEEFVSAYEKDYLECLEEAKKYDLDIIFGIEEVVYAQGIEALCYGITPEILYKNPHLKNCSFDEWVKTMHENGVLVIQAHPFREADYIPKPMRLPIDMIDGLEVYNGHNSREDMNENAMALANANPQLIKTSSGDAHNVNMVCCGGIKTRERIKNSKELADILRKGSYQLILSE